MRKSLEKLLLRLTKEDSDSLKRRIRNQKLSLPHPGEIKLSYAGMLPGPDQIVSGGLVKLIHLEEVYPEQESKFSILYLVSSALPWYVEEWVTACKNARVKVVWNQNGIAYPAWAGADYEKFNRPLRESIHLADWVVYQSEFCKLGADTFLGSFEGPHSIIYNCVDTAVFAPSETRITNSPVRLLVMGSHHQAYRVIVPLEVLSILLKQGIEAELTIAGRLAWPDAEEEVQDKVVSLGLQGNVEIFGPYLQSEAPGFYQSSHILLHPKYNDACPTVPIEAMSCGVPVVASGSGGVPELLGSTGGITIDAPLNWEKVYVASPEEMAAPIVSIMKDWDRWSAQARKRAVEYLNKENWVKEHEAIFRHLIK